MISVIADSAAAVNAVAFFIQPAYLSGVFLIETSPDNVC